MNLSHCYNVLYLIHFYWKLTRFSLYPAVLSLIGLSRTDWNLINLLNGSDCCRILTVCSECILERQKNTGADLDYYLCALKTIFFCSSELRALWQSSTSVGWYCHGKWELLCSSAFYVYKWAGSSCLTPPAPPLMPSRQRKVLHELFFFPPLFFYHRFNLWWNSCSIAEMPRC